MTKFDATKKRLSLLFAVLMLVATVLVIRPNHTVSAQSVKELQKQQQELEKEQNRLKKEIDSLDSKTEKQKILKANIESQIATIEGQLTAYKEEITRLDKETKALEKKKTEDIEKYKDRFREMYMSPEDSALSALLNSESFSEYLVQQDAIDRVYQSDEQMLQSVIDSILKIEQNKKDVEEHKKEIEQKTPELEKKKQEHEAVLLDLQSMRGKSKAELDEIQGRWDAQNDELTALIQQLEAEEKEKENEQNNNGGSGGGDENNGSDSGSGGGSGSGNNNGSDGGSSETTKPDPDPVPSGGWSLPVRHANPYVTCLFGDDVLNGAYRFHYGLDISGYDFTGTPVVATKGGTVEYAGWVSGYGNFVLISHGKIDGKTMRSAYAHLDYISVSSGQKVSQEQKLGGAGNTGDSYGAHLHFEIRHGSDKYSAVNPEIYIPKLPRRLV